MNNEERQIELKFKKLVSRANKKIQNKFFLSLNQNAGKVSVVAHNIFFKFNPTIENKDLIIFLSMKAEITLYFEVF